MSPLRVNRRGLLLGAGSGATAAVLASWWRAKRADHAPQGPPLAVDLQDLPSGKLLTLNWQDKPVWVLRRSPAELAALADHETLLLDADSQHSVQPQACRNQHRSLRPAIFVAVGLCTHQGCTPQLRGADGFTCPCHASHYDLAGRVFKAGPAPANLVIPTHHFASENRLVLGTST